jgi:hypothetical protein
MIHMSAAHKEHAASHAMFLPHSTVGGPAPRDRLRPHHRSVLRHVHNDRLLHSAALRQLANRLVGIPHDCLKTRTFYDEATT